MIEKRKPYADGQYIVWFVKDKDVDADLAQEICDNCGVTVANMKLPERCVVLFDESKAEEVMEKLYAWPEYIRSVSRNHFLCLC